MTQNKKEFSDHVIDTIRTLAEAEKTAEAARQELDRIFGKAWTETLEATLIEDREVCVGCKKDSSAAEMTIAGFCYECQIKELASELDT